MQNDRLAKQGRGWARKAHLHYVSDSDPGIRRIKAGDSFRYRNAKPADLARIKALVLPPAWTDVWICADAAGHIQAIGRDARGRKQYRYHARWRATRDENKFDRMLSFGRALPKIRAAVGRQIRQPGLNRKKVVAAVVRLLDLSAIRVGNEEYAAQNHSYGLTTLHPGHASVKGTVMHFHFRGKSGKDRRVDIDHPVLSRIVRKCQHLPGQHLFQFVERKRVHHITSSDVNNYIASVTGQPFTAKDFRTWKGTLLAASYLGRLMEAGRRTKRAVVEAVKHVAGQLGNTPAICRKCYIHPSIIACYMDGTLSRHLKNGRSRSDEFSLLIFLQRIERGNGYLAASGIESSSGEVSGPE